MAEGVRPQTFHLALALIEFFEIASTPRQFKVVGTVEKMRQSSSHWLHFTLATRSVASRASNRFCSGFTGIREYFDH